MLHEICERRGTGERDRDREGRDTDRQTGGVTDRQTQETDRQLSLIHI